MTYHVVMPGFAPARIIHQGLSNIHATWSNAPKTFWLIDAHYPINRSKNVAEIHRLAQHFGLIVLDPGRDLGLHGNLNFWMDQVKPEAGDVMIGVDPDSNPITPGWDQALLETLSQNKEFGAVSLFNPKSEKEFGRPPWVSGRGCSHRALIAPQPMTCTVTAFDLDLIRAMGGFRQPKHYWGGFEKDLWARMALFRRRWGFLKDFKDLHDLNEVADPEYTEWKFAHFYMGYKLSFESYLSERSPEKLL